MGGWVPPRSWVEIMTATYEWEPNWSTTPHTPDQFEIDNHYEHHCSDRIDVTTVGDERPFYICGYRCWNPVIQNPVRAARRYLDYIIPPVAV